jgi:hypothetical protein
MRDIPDWSYKLTNPTIVLYDKIIAWCSEQFESDSWWPVITPTQYGQRDVEFKFDNEHDFTNFLLKWS